MNRIGQRCRNDSWENILDDGNVDRSKRARAVYLIVSHSEYWILQIRRRISLCVARYSDKGRYILAVPCYRIGAVPNKTLTLFGVLHINNSTGWIFYEML